MVINFRHITFDAAKFRGFLWLAAGAIGRIIPQAGSLLLSGDHIAFITLPLLVPITI
jgi:hypothetical protein